MTTPHVEERDGQAVWVCDGKVWGRWDGKPPATGSARPVKALYNAFDRAAIYDQSARLRSPGGVLRTGVPSTGPLAPYYEQAAVLLSCRRRKSSV